MAGSAPYIDDLPELAGTLHAALGLSPVAHGRIAAIDLARIQAMPGVVAVLTAHDIPGVNDCGPVIHDDPILADGVVHYVGQPVFAVIAETRNAARLAAAGAKAALRIEPLPALLTPVEAHAAKSYVLPPMHLARGDARAAIDAAPHRLKDTLEVGGQEQFYLEGQISYAVPREDSGMLVHCSTQHPSEMQHLVAHCLGLHSHHVQVECRRMGGGFGGKESQSGLFACVAAVAAHKLGRPVKLRLDRDDDFMITGRRHCFHYEYEVGFDDDGRVLGAELTMVSRAGFSADLSGPVMTRAVCHFDNAYWLPDVAIHGYSGRTNTQSNTAFRGFGGPQGAIAIENILDSIARRLGKDAARRAPAQLLRQRAEERHALRPAGRRQHRARARRRAGGEQRLSRAARSDRHVQREERGPQARPGADAGQVRHLLQPRPSEPGRRPGARLWRRLGARQPRRHGDGPGPEHQGGAGGGARARDRLRRRPRHRHRHAEGGQHLGHRGLDRQRPERQGGAGRGTADQGAARRVCGRALRRRCDDVRFANGSVEIGSKATLAFRELVVLAYMARVQLWSDGFYATPGLSWDMATMQGRPFFYFAYGAAVSEVVVDTLTGEWKLLAAHVLHDAGRSLNPAIDIGQVEGGFIQGMGWLTTEELVWQPNDGTPKAGLLLTHAPSTYKIPTANDCPPVFDVRLWQDGMGTASDNVSDTIHRSKATGEPPLLLPFSVFFAIRDAVSAAGGHRVDPPLSAPATSEAILRAITALQSAEAAA